MAPAPGAPPGSTPNALGLSPDGRRLLVANADNKAVAVLDVSSPDHSRVEGFIPTGWYPTAAQFSGTPDARAQDRDRQRLHPSLRDRNGDGRELSPQSRSRSSRALHCHGSQPRQRLADH